MNQPTNTQKVGMHIASELLDIKAIKLDVDNPFTWSSGWKSPIYCDNRLALSHPEVRTIIKKALADAIRVNYPDVEAIAGVATAGIPQGALVAEELGLPFIYVRPKPKSHGMQNLIEGKVTPGQKVVILEDLISTGGSSLKAAEALQEAGFRNLGMIAIFTYGFALADQNFKEANIPLICLSNYDHLLQEALKRNYIKKEQLDTLQAWRQDPGGWS